MYGEAEFRTGRGGVHSRGSCLFVILKNHEYLDGTRMEYPPALSKPPPCLGTLLHSQQLCGLFAPSKCKRYGVVFKRVGE